MKNNTTESIKSDILKRVNEDTLNSSIDISFEKNLCFDLSQSTKTYNPETTFDVINSFSKNESNRMLFSEIYSFVSGLDDNHNSIFVTNINTLLSYAKSKNDKKFNDTKKIIVKIYDHVHLAILQDDKVKKFFDKNIKDSKSNVEKEIKTLQSQSVTILGIFSSFVVAFVGGLVFSSSVFSSIGQQSIYKLILVIVLLGFVLITICFSLYWFIAKIINKCDDSNKLNTMYIIASVVVLILLVALYIFWNSGIVEKRNKRILENNDSAEVRKCEINVLTDNLYNSTYSELSK